MNKIGKAVWVLAAILAIAVGGCAAEGSRQSTGAYIDDSSITAKVKSEMIADKTVSARNINVTSLAGVVRLEGNIESQQESDRAVAIANGVAGVKSVENRLTVK